MAYDANLAPHHHAPASLGAACDPCLGGEDVVFAQFDVMGDLDEVVDFGAAGYPGRFESGSVEGSIGADFDVVFEDHIAKLLELSMLTFFVGGVAKATGANDGTWLEDDAIAEGAILADNGVGVEEAIFAYLDTDADVGKRANGCAATDFSVFVDDGVGADVYVFTEFCGLMDYGGGVDAGKTSGFALFEKCFCDLLEGAGWVVGNEVVFAWEKFGVGADADDPGGGCCKKGGIAIIGEKRSIFCSGGLKISHCCDDLLWISLEFRSSEFS